MRSAKVIEKKDLCVDNLTVHVTRKNMKNMYLRVRDEEGCVEVSAPHRVSDTEIIRFVEGRMDWINKAQERAKKAARLKETETVPAPFMEREMRQRLRRQIAAFINKWEPVMGVNSNGFTIKKMKSRWGSCNVRTHHLNFNLMLEQKPAEEVEYVVVHELTHLLEASHSPRFWALMEHYLPGAKQLRRKLNDAGAG